MHIDAPYRHLVSREPHDPRFLGEARRLRENSAKMSLSLVLAAADEIRKKFPGWSGVLLGEHGHTTLDGKVQKGGINLHQRYLPRKLWENTEEDLVDRLQTEENDSLAIGVDPSLSDLGRSQAACVRTVFDALKAQNKVRSAEHGDRGDTHAFTSTQRRTQQTAEGAGLGYSYHELAKFDERINLIFHGLPKEEIRKRYPELMAAKKAGKGLEHKGIEPEFWFYDRTRSGLLQAEFEYMGLRNLHQWIPIITHQSNIKMIAGALLNRNPWEIDIDNGSLTAILMRRIRLSDEQIQHVIEERRRWREVFNGRSMDPKVFRGQDHMPHWSPEYPSSAPHGVVVALNHTKHLDGLNKDDI